MQALAMRNLSAPDILRLGEPRATKPEPIAKLRHRHHALARCLALGMADRDASLATGYCVSRISILKGDEMFRELVASYEADAAEAFSGVTEQLAGLTAEALTELRDKIEEGKVPVRDLIEIAKLGADRSGHGPTSTQHTRVSVDLKERLTRAARRAESRVIDVTAVEEVA